ncbi:MAG: transglutaminase-like domain-containing protein [Treponema sp.]|nr:transglutaminase-like domain-containing protein [Treponema sp.]
MKKSINASSIILFFLRLFLYFSTIVLIFIHPGISISFDHTGIIQWLIVIPLMALFAFIPLHKIKLLFKCIIVLILLLVLSLIAGARGIGLLQFFAAGLISFFFTILLFQRSSLNRIPLVKKLTWLVSLEPFFLAWVCLRLLALSRSGEEIAGQSIALTQFILVWTIVVFLFHSVIIYLCFYQKSCVKVWKEAVIFSSGVLVVFFIVIMVLPPDFVRNVIVENLVTDRVPQRINPSDTDRSLPLRSGGRRTLPRGEGRNGDLRGIPEQYWQGRGSGSGDSRQYMVKIVASKREPVYMSEYYYGQLDPVRGFILSRNEPLNELAHQRFFVTWSDNDPISEHREFEMGRERQEVFSLSTLSHKYLPYRPVEIDPTILNEDSGPLRFVHQVVSYTHAGDPLMLVNTPTRTISEREKNILSHYLELPLEADDLNEFTNFLNSVLSNWRSNRYEIINNDRYLKLIFEDSQDAIQPVRSNRSSYLETIVAILVGFSDFQYNLFYDNDSSIADLKDFIFNSKEGDCVEFSNTLALLGRIAGIPSRVVTGYLAAEGLQTPAHLRGLSNLRARIPVLQQFPFDDLYMVTNLHSHSWTQFYIPDYGWLDFEATSFALPPNVEGDFNNWDVVIPTFSDNRTLSQIRKFPWQAVGRVIIALVIFALICAYVLLFGRELILYIGYKNQKNSARTRSRFLYLLMLSRLAADGQPIKPASKTAHEYSEIFPKSISQRRRGAEVNEVDIIKEDNLYFKKFADLYSELQWRQFSDSSEMNEKLNLLWQEYQNILKSTLRRGLHHVIKRLISLRGLAYL